MAGADAATLPPGVLRNLAKHPLTDKSLESFLADWKKTGQGHPMRAHDSGDSHKAGHLYPSGK